MQGRVLDIYIQVNTSGEPQKGGVAEAELRSLVRLVSDECPNLRVAGLMTIGAASAPSPAADFDRLCECRVLAAQALHAAPDTLDLSMGMSSDYEQAIRHGATSVRIGSLIFGARG